VKQNKPAPYSNTDFQENESVFLFESKIDRKCIKTQIKTREKIPNVDGYIEIVDEDNVPIYKFEIQIRTIKNKKSYYCPIETVSYTNVTTLPILLILVDITQKIVYWKHLIRTNARQSKSKKSYIYDLSELDIIGDHNDYITRWKIIAQNYIEKIQTLYENATILEASEEIFPPKNLSQEAIIYFQKYIDRINYLLDHHYSIVKQIYFSKYWKLGVSVYKFGTDVSFGIRGIPYGKSDLLVTEIENTGENWMFSKEFLHSTYFSKNEDDPEKKANDFVLQYVKKVFDRKLLLPVGKMMTEEYVYFVISKCYYMFGLKKSNSYSVDDIINGLNKYLLLWVSIALDHIDYPKNPLYPNEINVIDIVYLADILFFSPEHFPNKLEIINQVFFKVVSEQEHYEIKGNIKFYSMKIDFYIFINSLNYLKDHNIKKVEVSLIEPNYDLLKNKKAFFRCNLYTPENRKEYIIKFYKAIQAIINEFVDYYELPKEYKLYSNEKCHYFIIPSIGKRPIGNISMEDAEITVIITERFEDEISNVTIIEDDEYIKKSFFLKSWEKGFFYYGRTYNLISWSDGLDVGVFDELPFYNRVYSHLQKMVEKISKKNENPDVFL